VAFGFYARDYNDEFCWETSDVDFIVVVDKPLCRDEKLALLQALKELAPNTPPRGIEMSVVLREHCQQFVYPTPYELHMSREHMDTCDGNPKTDYDLAAHFMMILYCGLTWYGTPKTEIFMPVPREYFVDSIVRDLPQSVDEIMQNPYYHIANLCRVASYLLYGKIYSKRFGIIIYSHDRPAHFGTLMREAYAVRDGRLAQVTRRKAKQFLMYMHREIDLMLDTEILP
jgi:streptomycin 3"-adenylyltransferase